jgi:hypothetical protein
MDYKQASELFEIDETSPSGLRWKVDTGKKMKAGAIAGCINGNGYWIVRVSSKNYYVHRVVWLLVNRHWPTTHLDHKNGDRSKNGIDNLRACFNKGLDNMQNMKIPKTNKSGFMGVCWSKRRVKWQASITKNRLAVWLGYHNTPEEAHAAYVAAKRQLHTFNPEVRSNGSQL